MSLSAAADYDTGTHQPASSADDHLDAVTHRLVSDLHEPRSAIFWIDLVSSATIGWASFGFAVLAPPFSPAMLASILVAMFALYRGMCFVHELTHLRRRSLPGFETAWNALFGVPLLLPSFTYIGVHQSHHSLSTYGTRDDPEYLPFASSRKLIWLFAVQASLVLPLALLVRFLPLTAIGLVWPRFHRWLEANASSFSMNPAYRRIVSEGAARTMRRWEAITFGGWCSLLGLIAYHVLPGRILVVWFVVLVLISLVNTLRVLGAHEYDSDGNPLDRHGQLSDSIDTPGGPWTELWAPVGLRYHALHHFFPGIPYHNLGTAYRRIVKALPDDSLYRESTSPSLRWSLNGLCAKAKQRSAALHDALRNH
jgi:fatty acid desaturase